jgi:Skp family chaperone for outer membrane proteins
MTRHRFSVVLIGSVVFVGLVGLKLFSAEEAAKPKKAQAAVVVINVNRIFKESKTFTKEVEELKKEVKEAEEQVKKERDSIKSQTEDLEKFTAGSDERNEKEEYLSKLQAALAASIGLQKSKFLRRESAIYLETYQRVEAELAAYAKENGIDIVLRLQDDPLDASKPDNVLSRINRQVVWASSDVDITSIIAERLDKSKESPKEDVEKEKKDQSS